MEALAPDGHSLPLYSASGPKSEEDTDSNTSDASQSSFRGTTENVVIQDSKRGVQFASLVESSDYEVDQLTLDRRTLLLKSGRQLASKALKLQKISVAEEDFTKNKKKHRLHWYHTVFIFSIACLVVCLLQLYLPPPFGVMMTSAEIGEIGLAPGCEGDLDHCICPRETICATNVLSIVLLTLARCSAFFDYPLYMMMFLSKCHNLNNIFRRTLLREWINFADMHKIHKLFGVMIGIETMSHSFFHMLRWGLNGDIGLLWETKTGITGLIAMFASPLICWPMVVPVLKQKMKFELRKGLHYLAVVWALALLWHAPERIYYLIGIPALVYAADYFFSLFIRNTLIENAYFERYGENGVAIHFSNPQSWGEKPKTSYLYIMIPWISKTQWHAFTMFPDANKANYTMLCISAGGDWTKELHDKIKVPTYKSFYVLGPYLSEFSDRAVTTSNAIAVASGIGITPTLSLMMNYAGKKRINIIWMCRDAGLVEYVLHRFEIEAVTKNSYAFIYYTGKRELALPKNLPVNLFIFNCRPKLEESITSIIASIQSGEDLPEDVHKYQSMISNVSFEKRMQVALCRVMEIYGADEMFEYAVEETQKKVFQLSKDIQAEVDGSDPEAVATLYNVATPDDIVCLEGLDAMISRFCGGIGEYSQAELKAVFDRIDTDRTGFIDRKEMDVFIDLITQKTIDPHSLRTLELESHLEKTERSMRGFRSSRLSLQSSQAILQTRNKQRSSTGLKYTENWIYKNKDQIQDWSVFYCGGSKAIEKNLNEISKKYSVPFAKEAFGW